MKYIHNVKITNSEIRALYEVLNYNYFEELKDFEHCREDGDTESMSNHIFPQLEHINDFYVRILRPLSLKHIQTLKQENYKIEKKNEALERSSLYRINLEKSLTK